MQNTHNMAAKLRSIALSTLADRRSNGESDETMRLWDTVLSNVTVGEFRLIENAMREVIARYFPQD